MCVLVCVCITCMAFRGQEGAVELCELELWALRSHHRWMPGPKPRSSGRVVSAPTVIHISIPLLILVSWWSFD